MGLPLNGGHWLRVCARLRAWVTRRVANAARQVGADLGHAAGNRGPIPGTPSEGAAVTDQVIDFAFAHHLAVARVVQVASRAVYLQASIGKTHFPRVAHQQRLILFGHLTDVVPQQGDALELAQVFAAVHPELQDVRVPPNEYGTLTP